MHLFIIIICVCMFSSETLISDFRHLSELLAPGYGLPVLLCRDMMPRAQGSADYVRDGSVGCVAAILRYSQGL